MKKILSVLLTVCMLASMCATFAVTTSAANHQYVSEFRLSAFLKAQNARDDLHGYHMETVSNVDLNEGTAGYYVYLGAKYTSVESEAIRDIIVMLGDEYGSMESWYNEGNGCTYYPVGGNTHDGWMDAIDLNIGAGGSYIYLYYTKDANAGNPISDPIITLNDKGSDGRNSAALLYDFGGEFTKADLNRYAGGDYVYLYYNQYQYFSDLIIGSGMTYGGALKSTNYKNHRILSYNDLNEDAGGRYLFMSYMLTGKKEKAITNIIALDEDEDSFVDRNGITYLPIGGYTGNWIKNMDTNYKAGGDYVYLYYTTDSRAGNPITSLDVTYTYDSTWESVKYGGDYNYNEVADLGKDAGGCTVYLKFKRDSFDNFYSGSVFTNTSSTIWIVIAAVIVIGVVAVIVLTKKRKAAVTA